MTSTNPPANTPLDRPRARRGNPHGFRDANRARRQRAKNRAVEMLALRIMNRANATEIAQQFGISRDAVYAARYRLRHDYPQRRSRVPAQLSIEYVYSTATPSQTS